MQHNKAKINAAMEAKIAKIWKNIVALSQAFDLRLPPWNEVKAKNTSAKPNQKPSPRKYSIETATSITSNKTLSNPIAR